MRESERASESERERERERERKRPSEKDRGRAKQSEREGGRVSVSVCRKRADARGAAQDNQLDKLIHIMGSSLKDFLWNLDYLHAHLQVPPQPLSHTKDFVKLFCQSQFPHKFVKLSRILVTIQDELTNLYGN